MICRNCGAENADTNRYCANCGQKLPDTTLQDFDVRNTEQFQQQFGNGGYASQNDFQPEDFRPIDIAAYRQDDRYPSFEDGEYGQQPRFIEKFPQAYPHVDIDENLQPEGKYYGQISVHNGYADENPQSADGYYGQTEMQSGYVGEDFQPAEEFYAQTPAQDDYAEENAPSAEAYAQTHMSGSDEMQSQQMYADYDAAPRYAEKQKKGRGMIVAIVIAAILAILAGVLCVMQIGNIRKKQVADTNMADTQVSEKDSISEQENLNQISLSGFVGTWIDANTEGISFTVYRNGNDCYIQMTKIYGTNAQRIVQADDCKLTAYEDYAMASYEEDGWGHAGEITLTLVDNDTINLTVTSRDNGKEEVTKGYNLACTGVRCVRYSGDYENDNSDLYVGQMIYPSDTVYITADELQYYTKDQIYLMRNEIYARHGYIFDSQNLQNYFSAQPWYMPNPNYNDSMLNAVEKANIDTIVNYEKTQGWR